jgi:hypothetical protein
VNVTRLLAAVVLKPVPVIVSVTPGVAPPGETLDKAPADVCWMARAINASARNRPRPLRVRTAAPVGARTGETVFAVWAIESRNGFVRDLL